MAFIHIYEVPRTAPETQHHDRLYFHVPTVGAGESAAMKVLEVRLREGVYEGNDAVAAKAIIDAAGLRFSTGWRTAAGAAIHFLNGRQHIKGEGIARVPAQEI